MNTRSQSPKSTLRWGAALLLTVTVCGVVGVMAGCDRLSGEYAEVNGPGKLEFKGGKVYITTMLGMTFVTSYEVEGDRVIIKGADGRGGGSQVFTRSGDTIDAGMGVKYVKKS
jgi:hypothetical protein